MPSGPERLIWSPSAERDVREIWSYYAAEASPAVADRVLDSIRAAAPRIGEHPFSGRSRDEVRVGLRSVLAPPYVIFYRLRGADVFIVRVLHERRDLVAALAKKD